MLLTSGREEATWKLAPPQRLPAGFARKG